MSYLWHYPSGARCIGSMRDQWILSAKEIRVKIPGLLIGPTVHPPHDSCPTIHTSQNSSQGDPRVWLRGVDSGGPSGGPMDR